MNSAVGPISPRDRERVERVARERGIPVERAAIALGLLSEEQLLYRASEASGVDLVFPSEESLDRDLLAQFPKDVLRRHGALPLLREEDAIVVAFPELPDPVALAELEAAAEGRVRPVLAPPPRLGRLIDRVVGGGAVDAARVSAEDASGMTAFYRHLAAAFGAGAEELRFEPATDGVRVRYRTNGALAEAAIEPRELGAGIATRARMLAGLPAPEEPALQRSAFVARIRGEDVHLRTVILPVSGGEAILLRRESGHAEPVDLDDFDLGEGIVAQLRTGLGAAGELDLKGRLILVAAPEGDLVAGFARALREIVHEANVTAAAGFTLRDALAPAADEPIDAAVRSLLALDPDVLFVDGGSDATAAKEAVAAALSGVRVVYGLVDPIPEDAKHLVQAAGVHPARLGLVLSHTVAIRRETGGGVVAGAARSDSWREGGR